MSALRALHLFEPPRRARAVAICLTVLGAALTACGGSDATAPTPAVSISIAPGTATVNAGETQSFTATVTNATNSGVTWTASGGVISGSGPSATWTAPFGGGPYTITATSVADPSRSASASVSVTPIGLSLSVSAFTVGAAGTQVLTASVSNSSNTNVTWSATGGTLSGSGASVTWTAPASGGTYTITAASTADPTRTASATATVTPVQIAVSPATQVVWRGEPIMLTATVSGTANTAVQWSTTCGSIAGSGVSVTFTSGLTAGNCAVVARSGLDTTRTATSVLTVRSAWRVAALDDASDGACTFTHCSLREAITAANAQPDVDTIRILSTGGGTITLGSALPVIEAPLHIVGPGVDLLTLHANGTVASFRRGFEFRGAITASLLGLTVRGGVAGGGAGIAVGDSADVTLTDLRVVANEARGGNGGGVRFTSGARGLLRNVVVDSNRTVGDLQPGGGLSVAGGAVVHMRGGAVRFNRVSHGWGGGVRVLDASLTLDTVDVRGNVVEGGAGTGGGLLAEGASGSLLLRGSTVRDNMSPVNAGGLSLTNGLGTATISGTTITGNRSRFGAGLLAFNVNALTIASSSIEGNRASTRGGGLAFTGSTNAVLTNSRVRLNIADSTGGGGVYLQNTASARLTAVVMDSNQANGPSSSTQGGGGAWVGAGTTFEMTGGSASGNVTESGWGGAVWSSSATVRLTEVTAANNRASGSGGALALNSGTAVVISNSIVRDNQALLGSGGGLLVQDGTLTLTNTQITGNVAGARGGGVQLSANAGTTTATLTEPRVTGNRAQTDGGGIGAFGSVALTITGGVLDDNRSVTATGGGLSRNSTLPLVITGTRITRNRAETQGGGLQLVGSGASTLRAALVQDNSAQTGGGGVTVGGAAALIEQSTFNGNTTATGNGGGIFSSSTATSTIRNVTLTANTAVNGGGIGVTGTATILHATIVSNGASGFGAGIASNTPSGNVTITNSLLARNLRLADGQNCNNVIPMVIASGGGNLSDDSTCNPFLTLPSDRRNTPAGINMGQSDNGGPTPTHALLSGSAAIDGGVPAACLAADQRGFGRQGVCDIGAFEFGGVAPAAGASRSARSATPVRRRE